MYIPLRRCFKKLPIIAVGCLLHSLFKIQLAGERPIVITANCDNPLPRGKTHLGGRGTDYQCLSCIGGSKMYGTKTFVFRIAVPLTEIVN